MSVPPGASYQASNRYVKFKRRLLDLEDPVRIQFKEEWRGGNPLYDWFQRRTSTQVKEIQLRKELKSPFFHEYVAFELSNGEYFRIDRRQLQDEAVPLECIYKHGVEAYDTIEQMTSLEDDSYSRSDWLAKIRPFITSRNGIVVTLGLILKVLWAIHRHPLAKVYTLQRYNCYFVAQTIILLTARSDPGFLGEVVPGRGGKSRPLASSIDDWDIAGASGPRHSYHSPFSLLDYLPCSILENNYPLFRSTGEEDLNETLLDAMTHLFQQISSIDQGFCVMCLTHLESCLICTQRRTPFSSPRMTFNPASKASNQPSFPMDSGDTRLFHLRSSLIKYWRHTLSVAFEKQEQTISMRMRHIREQCNRDQPNNLKQVISEALDEVLILNDDTRSSWAAYALEALQLLAKDIEPLVQRALECPSWEIMLTTELNTSNIIHFRQMDNWVQCVAPLFESEYERLERAARNEVLNTWLLDSRFRFNHCTMMHLRRPKSAKEPNDLGSRKPDRDLGRSYTLSRMQAIIWEMSRQRESDPVVKRAYVEDLTKYLDNLVMDHGNRVEQYALWLRCTQSEIYEDISRTQGEVWRTFEDCSDQAGGASWVPRPVTD